MQCFYCAEEIKPEAIRCKHCHRDLPGNHGAKGDADLPARLADLGAAVAAVEEGIAALQDRAAEAGTGSAVRERSDSEQLGWFVVVLIAGVASLATGVAEYFYWKVPLDHPAENSLLVLSIGLVPFAALVLGFLGASPRWPRMVLVGVTGVMGAFVGEELGRASQQGLAALSLEEFVYFLVASVTSGVFGGWLGDRVLRREEAALGTRVRRLVIGRRATQSNDLLQRLGDFARAITPLVSALVPLALVVLQFFLGSGEKPQ